MGLTERWRGLVNAPGEAGQPGTWRGSAAAATAVVLAVSGVAASSFDVLGVPAWCCSEKRGRRGHRRREYLAAAHGDALKRGLHGHPRKSLHKAHGARWRVNSQHELPWCACLETSIGRGGRVECCFRGNDVARRPQPLADAAGDCGGINGACGMSRGLGARAREYSESAWV